MVTSTPADASTKRELRIRAAVMAPRQMLPSHQRRLKGGTTSFMVVIHVLATVALLPRFWSWQGLVAFGVLYWMTVLGVTLAPDPSNHGTKGVHQMLEELRVVRCSRSSGIGRER